MGRAHAASHDTHSTNAMDASLLSFPLPRPVHAARPTPPCTHARSGTDLPLHAHACTCACRPLTRWAHHAPSQVLRRGMHACQHVPAQQMHMVVWCAVWCAVWCVVWWWCVWRAPRAWCSPPRAAPPPRRWALQQGTGISITQLRICVSYQGVGHGGVSSTCACVRALVGPQHCWPGSAE